MPPGLQEQVSRQAKTGKVLSKVQVPPEKTPKLWSCTIRQRPDKVRRPTKPQAETQRRRYLGQDSDGSSVGRPLWFCTAKRAVRSFRKQPFSKRFHVLLLRQADCLAFGFGLILQNSNRKCPPQRSTLVYCCCRFR